MSVWPALLVMLVAVAGTYSVSGMLIDALANAIERMANSHDEGHDDQEDYFG